MKPKLLICPLTTYERNGWYCPELVWFLFSCAKNQHFQIDVHPVHNFSPAAGGRNILCKLALEQKADWILMLDNDMVPPPGLLEMASKATEDMDILLPLFHMWDNTGHGQVKVVWAPLDQKEQISPEELQAMEWVELAAGGTGCIFIRRRVLEKVPYPWFQYEYDADGCMNATEDVPFLEQVRKHGFRIWGNTSFTVGHYRTVNLAKIQQYS